MEPSSVSSASVADIPLSTQLRRHVPSMAMIQTLCPRPNVTWSLLTCSLAIANSCLAARSSSFLGPAETPAGLRGISNRQIDTASIRADTVPVGQADDGLRRTEE